LSAAHRAVWTSLALLAPVVVFFVAAVLEPFDASMRALMTTDGYTTSATGRAVMIALFSLLPIALAVAAAPLFRRSPEGRRTLYPMNLVLAGSISAFLVFFGGAIVVDQRPCWQGAAICD
jgi:hypothetical protein